MPRTSARERTAERAICADSFITSPSCPVSTSLSPPPIGRRLHEEDVAARGVDRKTGRDAGHRCALRRLAEELLASERLTYGRARRSRRAARRSSEAILVAVLRRMAPSSRSSWRTPASRVYSDTTVSSASSAIETSSSRSPARSRCRGHRYPRAMADFSSVVYPSKRITSMRSSSGPGIDSTTLAVAMKKTCERSSSTSR